EKIAVCYLFCLQLFICFSSTCWTGRAAASRPVGSNRASKFTSQTVILLLVSALLAAALIVIYRLSFDNWQKKKTLQTLKEENEALRQMLTETQPDSTVQPTTSQLPEVTPYDPCPKCEEGWEHHRGRCYYFTTNKSPWEESRNECRDKGGDLVKIDGQDEQVQNTLSCIFIFTFYHVSTESVNFPAQTFLERRLREAMIDNTDKFWIGLTDSQEEGRWLWVDGSPLDTSFWGSNQPDNWIWEDPDGEDCVRMGEKTGDDDLECWFDKSCKVPHKSICEKKEKRATCV
ncbi:CD209 antigen-like protein E, partial [Stegastes partitus]|uniref:CD209 antigen-like protein E n=1 Tax=Stegastes partitus TaxID=144197 RepID=A0A9Y4NQW8_9TELE